jgi:hypothetical protein
MSQITKIALQTVFNPEVVNTLMELVNRTPNPEYAVEMLLGIEAGPYTTEELLLLKKNKKVVVDSTVSYDPWTKQVSGMEVVPEKLDCYVTKGTMNATIADVVCLYSSSRKDGLDIPSSAEYGNTEDLQNVYVDLGSTKQQSFYVSLSNW